MNPFPPVFGGSDDPQIPWHMKPAGKLTPQRFNVIDFVGYPGLDSQPASSLKKGENRGYVLWGKPWRRRREQSRAPERCPRGRQMWVPLIVLPGAISHDLGVLLLPCASICRPDLRLLLSPSGEVSLGPSRDLFTISRSITVFTLARGLRICATPPLGLGCATFLTAYVPTVPVARVCRE